MVSPKQNEEAELQNLLLNSDQRTNESLESTRRMKELCIQSEESGVKTLNMLHYQGEQLERIDEANNQIRSDVKEAEKHLYEMEKCCGLFSASCFRNLLPRKSSSEKKLLFWSKRKSADGQIGASQSSITKDRNSNNGRFIIASDAYLPRITNDAREDEMNENLGDVSASLGQLKILAQKMGDEVTRQDEIIDRNILKTESNDERLQKARGRADKIVKS